MKLYAVVHLSEYGQDITIVNGVEKAVKYIHNIFDEWDTQLDEAIEEVNELKKQSSAEEIIKGILEDPNNEFAIDLQSDDNEWIKVSDLNDESYTNLKEYFTWK